MLASAFASASACTKFRYLSFILYSLYWRTRTINRIQFKFYALINGKEILWNQIRSLWLSLTFIIISILFMCRRSEFQFYYRENFRIITSIPYGKTASDTSTHYKVNLKWINSSFIIIIIIQFHANQFKFPSTTLLEKGLKIHTS